MSRSTHSLARRAQPVTPFRQGQRPRLSHLGANETPDSGECRCWLGVPLVGLVVGLSDPAYYAPQDPIDYLAAFLNTAGPVAVAVALFV